MLNRYGDFSKSGEEFVINTPDIERNWYNYFFTDNYISFTSQAGVGQGFLQDDLGNRIMPVATRGMYAVADNKGWALTGLPTYDSDRKYRCVHGIGYTTIELERNGIKTEYTLFVPNEDSATTGCEVALVKVKNLTENQKTVKIISYCENDFDGRYNYQGYNVSSLKINEDINGICYRVDAGLWSGENMSFQGFMTSGSPISGYDCSHNAFIGPYNSVFDPIAIHKGGCQNSSCIAEKGCYALENSLTLEAGEEKYCTFVMGITESVERIKALSRRFATEEGVKKELSLVTEKYKSKFGRLCFNTPDAELNKLLNYWMKYQTELGSRWARVRHNGFRDMTSDTECLASFDPKGAWQSLKRIMTYQYSNGYAPRTVENGAIRDNNFSDNTVWLTFTAYYILNELGNHKDRLLEEVAFNDKSVATVYEHLKRSVDWLYNFKGHNGLIRIWCGDWNDCIDRAGKMGLGVSVWLTMAWYRANKQFYELASVMGDEEAMALSLERGSEMKALVDKYGWDDEGKYYIYAINDDGRRLGSFGEGEGRVHLNPQTWAVLSGISEDKKEITAMESAERELSYDLGTAVMTPAYTKYDRGVGSIGIKHPGVQENGGVYLHAMCWKLAADAMLGYEDRVEWDIERILPFRNPVVKGRCEPYVLPNSYMGRETEYRYGTPGQSWRTASGQWFLKAMVNFVFGVMPTEKGLALQPCLPKSWNEAEITKEFRGGVYHIKFIRTGNKKITLNGEVIKGNVLPVIKGEAHVICEI